MADLQTVIGLLYRADWTRLSLSAGVRSERDGDLAVRRLRAMRPAGFRPGPTMRLRPDPGGGPPIMEDVPEEELGGYHYGQAELLIAPGGRRTAGAVSATRSFLDGLHGGRPPASG